MSFWAQVFLGRLEHHDDTRDYLETWTHCCKRSDGMVKTEWVVTSHSSLANQILERRGRPM